MPTVPIAERRIQTAPLPGVESRSRASAETFGADIGRGLQESGVAVSNALERDRLAADQIAYIEADRQLGETETALLYDPKAGALQRRGKDAFAAPEEVMKAFDERTREIEGGLTTDRQRLAFKRAAVRRRLDVDRTVQRHVAGEIKSYDTEQTNAYIATEVNGGIAAAGNAERIALSVARTQAALADHAKRNGLPPEWLKQRSSEVTGKIHAGVIDRLLAAGSDRSAKSYYDEHKADIAGTDLARIEKALEVGSLRGESQRQADAILLKHDSLSEATEAARAIKDPEVRDAVSTRVKDYFATRNAAEADDRARTFRDAASVLEKSKGNLSAIAPGDWVKLEPERRRALEARSRQLREGVEPVTNWDRYYGLLSIASEDTTRAAFVRTDLMQYRHELADTEFKDLAGKQAALRSGKQSDEALDGYRTKKQIVDDGLASIGVDPTPKDGSGDARRVNEFRRQIDARLIDLQSRTGKKATTAEVQEIVDLLLVKGKVPGSGIFYDTRKRLYELKPGEAFDVAIDEIPPTERAKIEEALRRHNRPVTPATIIELFRQTKVPKINKDGTP